MVRESGFARKLQNRAFIFTAEYLPGTGGDGSGGESLKGVFGGRFDAVNVADNPYGPVVSSLAASTALLNAGVEPIYQTVTRDRNRIALQSDLLGAVFLGIRTVLCLSGYHQTLSRCPGAANVYDIDSVQLVAAVRRMRDEGILLDGAPVKGGFPVTVGAAANPFLKPLELNLIRFAKKVEAGAQFIQTQAVFDTVEFADWLAAVGERGLTERAAIIAGVLPLESADEAERLRDTYTDFHIPDGVIGRLRAAGDEKAQAREGLALFGETVRTLKGMNGLRGIHLLSGGKENRIPEFLKAAGLQVDS
jgi:methylenetetrahydrofolate reductase (NADPH)